MKILFSLTFLIIGIAAFAQQYPFHEHYSLDKNTTQRDFNKADEVYYYTKYLVAVEYEYDYNYGQFYKYYTVNYRVKLQTDYGVEEFNKVYIPLEDVVALKGVEAHIIKNDEVVVLDPEIEEFFSETGGDQYYYFPVSGLEKGDELNIVYTVKMEPEFNGDQYYFQSDIPIHDFDFYFIAPIDSKFAFRPHNDFPQPQKIDTILHRNQWYVHLDEIEAIEDEYFAEYNNIVMKVDVSLSAIVSGTEEPYSPFQNYADLLNDYYNVQHDSKTIKTIHALNKEIGVMETKSTKKRIRMIEDFMKMDFNMYAYEPGTPLSDVVADKKGGTGDAMKVYMALFDDAQIAYEYGYVTDRYDTKFVDDIESEYFLQYYFFYFPDVDEYLAPLDFSSRMGYLDFEWVPNNAYYVTHKTAPREASFKVKPIKETAAKDNQDSTVIRIKVAPNLKDVTVDIERYAGGYYGGKYQIYYDYYRAQRRQETEEDLLNFMGDKSQYKMTSLENHHPEDAFLKPLIIKGTATNLATSLVESAGAVTIFKLGEIFGEYKDLTQIKKKKTDYVFQKQFIRSRTIIIELPDGVKVQNPESIQTSDDVAESETIHLAAKFTIEGNVVTYKLEERWYSTHYSIDEKEDLMRVFNFKADLCKMNLILEKE